MTSPISCADRGALDVGTPGLGGRGPRAAAVVGRVVLLARGVADRRNALRRTRGGRPGVGGTHRSAHPTGTARRVVPAGRGRRRDDAALGRDRAVRRRRQRGGAGGGVARAGARVGAGRCRRRTASGRRSSTAPGSRWSRRTTGRSRCARPSRRGSAGRRATPAAAAPSRNMPGLRRAKLRTSSSSSAGSRFCSLPAKLSTMPAPCWSRSRAGPGAPELVPSARPRSSWASDDRLCPAFCCWVMACSRTWLRPWSSRSLAWRWVSWATSLAWSVAVEATWLPACTAVCWTFLASSLATSVVDGRIGARRHRGGGRERGIDGVSHRSSSAGWFGVREGAPWAASPPGASMRQRVERDER